MNLEQNFSDILAGVDVALSWRGLLFCFLGVTVGTFIGVLPGIGAMATMAMLVPLTFHVDPTTAIILLAGIYYGAAYGGATCSILLNLPGTPVTAVTCLDGYPMAQQGRAGVALFMTTIASFIGSIVGIILLAVFSPPLAQLALGFASQEYFSLMTLGLLSACLLTSASPFRSLTAVVFGLLLGLVGIDVHSGQPRLTFGLPQLYEGLPLVALMLGLFGLPEIIGNSSRMYTSGITTTKVTVRSMWPMKEDWKRSWKAILRGSAIGSFFGALPGTGGLLASFVSYAVERKSSKYPEQFGKGAIEGVVGPEAANNSAIPTAFIPTLTLGVPGDAIMALMLGVMMIHGVTPGPQLVTENPGMFWGLVISFLLGNIALLVLNIPLIGVWVRVLSIPYKLLLPSIVALVCIGIYSVNYAVSDLFMVMLFGLVGYGMLLLKLEPAPLVLGFVLGPLMEENFRRAMLVSNGDLLTFFERPVSAIFLWLCVALTLWMVYSEVRRHRIAVNEDRPAITADKA